jgi:glycosyltransferase involved in cell wall biosynthesis
MRLSIIIPAFNEEACLPALFDALALTIRNSLAEHDVQVIVVDDHSQDTSPQILECYCEQYEWLEHIRLLKNSGSHVAIFAGLSVCSGDAAFIMGADLQDPPSIISSFIEEWLRGHPIVLGERTKREDPWHKVLPSKVFNYFMSRFVLPDFPVNGGDVFLVDRTIINAVVQCREKNVNIFVLILSLSSDIGSVTYERHARHAGDSKWTTGKLLKLAFDSVITVGYLPLKTILWLGIGTFFFATMILFYLVVARLFGWIEISGWASTMALIAAFGGIQMISIAILGEYLWRNFDQTRNRPMFIIQNSKLKDKE